MFEEKIIDHELSQGKLDRLKSPEVQELESRGEVFAPMDFSSTVHKESAMLRDTLQQFLMGQNLNLVVDTVLANDGAAQSVKTMLDGKNYTYGVVSVQASKELMKAGIQDRWKNDYRKHLLGAESKEGRLGGRPVPSGFANNLYVPPYRPGARQRSG